MTQPTDSTDPWVIAGRYVIDHQIGRGGMGTVYLARDTTHGRNVAIKVLRDDLVSAGAADAFLREIHLVADLRHAYIVPLFDSGTDRGAPFYVMPFLEGESLKERLARDAQLPTADAIKIAIEVAEALSVAHAKGIVHSDVAPGNILLSDGHVMLLDFGIARAMNNAERERGTTTGLVRGTVEHMSPEQGGGERIDVRSDVYSLASVLYQMLAGEAPFTGSNAQAIIYRRATNVAPSVWQLRPSTPEHVERAIAAALERSPSDRTPNAAEFSAGLEGRGLPDLNRSGSSSREIAVTADRGARPYWRQRRTALAALAVAIIALLSLGARQLFWGGAALDTDRVAVFPLGAFGADLANGIGESTALYLGTWLDGTDPLRWLDGVDWLSAAERADVSKIPIDILRALSRAHGAAYFIDGRVTRQHDSVTVLLRLHRTSDGALMAHRAATGGAFAYPPALGTRAIGSLLAPLLGASRADVGALADRKPAAIANFLLGEREYRRARFAQALPFYTAAIRDDSSFAFAAAKGAETANWLHDVTQETRLVDLATSLRASLSPRYAHLVDGLSLYLRGDADSSIAQLRSALRLEPEWSDAWMLLGENYMHLLPSAAPLDSLSRDALERVIVIDSGFSPALYHLAQMALQRGDIARAQEMAKRFASTLPDSDEVMELRVALQCIRDGPQAVKWTRLVSERIDVVRSVGFVLAGRASHLPCATAALEALFTAPGTAQDRRWGAFLILNGIYASLGQLTRLTKLITSPQAADLTPQSAYLLDEGAGVPVDSQAMAEVDRAGSDFAGMSTARLWLTGEVLAHRGDRARTTAIAQVMHARMDSTHARLDSLVAKVLEARGALLQGDSSTALVLLQALKPKATYAELAFNPWESFPAERLALAELLLARKQRREAYNLASSFDSPTPVIYVLYLRRALELRLRAAEALDDQTLIDQSRARLQNFARTPALEGTAASARAPSSIPPR